MFIPILLGTGREGNQSSKVANYILNAMKEKGIETEIISPLDYLVNSFTERLGKERQFDEKGKKYQEIIKKADSIVVVTPEYNRSFPGEIKLMIDLLYEEYKGKRFYFVGVSDGLTGGVRAVESLMHAVVGVEAVPIKPKLFFPFVLEVFDEQGNLVKEEFKDRVSRFVEGLLS